VFLSSLAAGIYLAAECHTPKNVVLVTMRSFWPIGSASFTRHLSAWRFY
jgi:hypothetical protein